MKRPNAGKTLCCLVSWLGFWPDTRRFCHWLHGEGSQGTPGGERSTISSVYISTFHILACNQAFNAAAQCVRVPFVFHPHESLDGTFLAAGIQSHKPAGVHSQGPIGNGTTNAAQQVVQADASCTSLGHAACSRFSVSHFSCVYFRLSWCVAGVGQQAARPRSAQFGAA
jgi:hypothetical protein